MMPRILLQLPEGKPEPWLTDLRAALAANGVGGEVALWPGPAEAAAFAKDFEADYALGWKPPPELFASQPQLEAFFNLGAGVDALLELDRGQPGLIGQHIRLVRLEDAGMAEQMADYALHWVLHVYRRFDDYRNAQTQRTWRPRAPRRKADYAVGVLGVGRLGAHVGRALVANGFAVRGWANSPKPDVGFPVMTPAQAAAAAPTDAFLAGLAVLINLLPLTPATTGLLDGSLFSRLPPGAVVINLARGGHLVEADLLTALDSGHLHAAVLDVTNTEPLPADHPLWCHPKVHLTPHVSAITLRQESVAQVAGKIAALLRGEAISGVVARDQGY